MKYPLFFLNEYFKSGRIRGPMSRLARIECANRLEYESGLGELIETEFEFDNILKSTDLIGGWLTQLLNFISRNRTHLDGKDNAAISGLIAESFFHSMDYQGCIDWVLEQENKYGWEIRSAYFSIQSKIVLNEYKDAVAMAEQAIEMASGTKFVFYTIKGMAQRSNQEKELAAQSFAEALSRKPGYSVAAHPLMFIANQLSEEFCLELLMQLKHRVEDSNSPPFHNLLSVLSSRVGKKDSALLHARRSVELINREKVLAQGGRFKSELLPEPHFLIIGLAKCGTSSAYQKICTHPHVLTAARKELHFFSGHNFDKGMQWYLSNFANAVLPSGKPFITGEASPGYFVSGLARKNVVKHCKNTKLILLLRDPVARAISDYYHRKKIAGIPETIDAFFNHHFTNPDESPFLQLGVYLKKLQYWEQQWWKGGIHVVCAEHLFLEPEKYMKKIFEFLELDSGLGTDGFPYANKNYYPKASPEILDRLASYYAPHNQRLYDHIGESFGW